MRASYKAACALARRAIAADSCCLCLRAAAARSFCSCGVGACGSLGSARRWARRVVLLARRERRSSQAACSSQVRRRWSSCGLTSGMRAAANT